MTELYFLTLLILLYIIFRITSFGMGIDHCLSILFLWIIKACIFFFFSFLCQLFIFQPFSSSCSSCFISFSRAWASASFSCRLCLFYTFSSLWGWIGLSTWYGCFGTSFRYGYSYLYSGSSTCLLLMMLWFDLTGGSPECLFLK